MTRRGRRTGRTLPEAIMIIDSGLDTQHEDVVPWINEEEFDGRPLTDDDGNGIVDDIYGLNAYLLNGNVTDTDGHGTYLSGIVAATTNNEIGVASVTAVGNVIPCRMFTQRIGALSNLLKCLSYAIAQSGTRQRPPVLSQAIQQLANAGVTTVASTSGRNLGRPEWPALYGFESAKGFKTIPVTGLTASSAKMTQIPPNSAGSVVTAPGENIVSLGIHSTYGAGSGNAPAAAIVAGLLSINPDLLHLTISALSKSSEKAPRIEDILQHFLQT